jgi:uncharacterized FlaG/YvyC family protein
MTNDISVYSLNAAAPVSRKDSVDPVKAVQAVKPEQVSSSDEDLLSALAEEQKPGNEELEQTVQDLNSLVQDLQRQVRFSLDDNSGEMVGRLSTVRPMT